MLRIARRTALACLLVAGLLASPAAGLGEGADGRFETRTSAHFILHQDVDLDRQSGLRGSDRFERDVLGVLEAAYDRLSSDLGLRPERKLAVYVYDPVLFDQQFAGVFRFPVAGFFGQAIHIRGEGVVSNALIRTLYHELVHAALAAAGPSVVVPAWLNEGLAEWFERRATGRGHPTAAQWNALGQHLRAGQWIHLGALSGPSLGGLPPPLVPWAYLQAYAMVEHLARTRGRDGLSRFTREMIRVRDPLRAMQKVYGLDPVGLEAALLAELQ